MKIAITGHTDGLGKALFDLYPDSVGFSRSNGFDINEPVPIIDALDDCDVFINNAYSEFAQVDLLYGVFDMWKHNDKLIINVSSNSGDGIKTKVHKYAVHKSALDKASEQLNNTKGVKCKIVNLRPGYIATNRVKSVDAPKIKTSDVANLVRFIIDSRDLYHIPNITVLPN